MKNKRKPSYEPAPNTKYKKISEEEFLQLRKHWYERAAKLAEKQGDEDIEWHDWETGKGEASPYLKNPIEQRAKNYTPEKEEFYTRLREFVTNHEFKNPVQGLIAKWYSEGISYRDMIPKLKRSKYKVNRSIFWIHTEIKKIEELIADYFEEQLWDFDSADFYNYEIGPGFAQYRTQFKKAKIVK